MNSQLYGWYVLGFEKGTHVLVAPPTSVYKRLSDAKTAAMSEAAIWPNNYYYVTEIVGCAVIPSVLAVWENAETYGKKTTETF